MRLQRIANANAAWTTYVFPALAGPRDTAMQVIPAVLTPSNACRALSEIMHDVKEAQEAITEVLDDEKALAGICLSEKDPDEALREGRQPPSMRLAAALLSSYERQIQSVEGALRACFQDSTLSTHKHQARCDLTMARLWA